MNYYGKTDIGCQRQSNEDTFIAQTIWNDTHLLCAAIDGIGGNAGGEVAAEITRNTIINHLEEFPVYNLSSCLMQAIIDANNEVVHYQRAVTRYRNMGCVMSVGIINIKDRYMHFGHLGDTRLYSLRDGQLKLLTRDETQGRLVTNYIGKRPILPHSIFCEIQEVQLKADTTLLFCTDGLWKILDEEEISNFLSLEHSSENICSHLISKANEKGSSDDVTAVVIKV